MRRWIGWRSVIKHRSGLKAFTLVVMISEAIVVMVRNTSHFRVTRALRVLFIVDTHFCRGVRRFLRQMFKSLPPILDMLFLLLFIMVIYAVLGFYLFGPFKPKEGSPLSPYEGSPYFKTFFLSFISLFVLLTTANYPDVMMPSYYRTQWSFLFFFSYLMINLYFIMNLLLAVVYAAFTEEEQKKFKKLFLHKRKACQHAFKLLVTKENPKGVCFEHFCGVVAFLSTSRTPMDNMLMFKLLNKSRSGELTLEEFYAVYDAVDYDWKPNKSMRFYYEMCKVPFNMISAAIHVLVRSKAFDYTIYALIICNGVLLIIQTSLLTNTTDKQYIYTPEISIAFISIYTLEMILKLIGLGFRNYFKSHWNLLDFSITLLGILSIFLTEFDIPSTYIMILRPLRLLRLFKVKKRFRDVFGTFTILMPRLGAAMIILALIGYFFGVVGFEIFGNLELHNCCEGTTVAAYYYYPDPGSNATSGIGYYYLNNFNTLPTAYVTLFELMVVNNWFIIMEAYASVTDHQSSRIFFMVYYIFTMVVVTIIVTFILEAFLFRIQYKKTMHKDDEIKELSTNITLDREEVFKLDEIYAKAGKQGFKEFAVENVDQTGIEFIGTKRRTKEELQKMMYKSDIVQWQEEAQAEEEERAREFAAAVLRPPQEDETVQVVGSGEQGEDITITRTLLDLPRTSLST
jgi:two pore calcium channel protein 1